MTLHIRLHGCTCHFWDPLNLLDTSCSEPVAVLVCSHELVITVGIKPIFTSNDDEMQYHRLQSLS